ncbi:PfkB family kinase, putative [Cordyceps militaris CM01]|uniref:PfkB family kinase, putative n=1 Tax=Cordyceps militaris (strain CM01) TaxID=983644 RepID=G3JKJ4_CORMM|nr:PfkB family kinase, putative [Cordyceps militaris CM01]EGX91433.1 PfkB family kinase, putative [Cordyceps militaris CM01]
MDIIMVGACYLDTILTVPHYPEEDRKLRASNLEIRRGGNCANSLEVLQQLIVRRGEDQDTLDLSSTAEETKNHLHLVSCLPNRDSPAAQQVIRSFGSATPVSFRHCIYREEAAEAASSYIIRSKETGSRTLVNYNALDEMTVAEFEAIARNFKPESRSWWHFEGRIPDTTLECMRILRRVLPGSKISVEVEKPGREGLRELAAEADVVFYSKAWAEIHCPVEQQPDEIAVVDRGDAGWDARRCVRFAVDLATLKVQREGFAGLGDAIMHVQKRQPVTTV